MYLLAAQSNAFSQIFGFIQSGGIFMFFILLCSFVAMTVILHRILSLRWKLVLPNELIYYIERLKSQGRPEDLSGLAAGASTQQSPLARILTVTFDLRDEDPETMRGAVEAAAREEVIKLQNGLSVLEVVITIAPMLGLLGTVSGLIGVFGVLGGSGAMADPNPALMAAGIAEALTTTIAGLVVAIPVVMAHSYFDKRIERMAARMEVLVAEVIQVLQKVYQRAPERTRSALETPVHPRQAASIEAMPPRESPRPMPTTWGTPDLSE